MKSDDQAVREIIERHNADIIRGYETGDIDAVAQCFAADAWQMPPNNPPLIGREAIRAFWTEAVTFGAWKFELETEAVAVSDALAVERGRYALQFTANSSAPPGMSSFSDRGNYLVHWQRAEDGEWRIMADAPVSELPLQR